MVKDTFTAKFFADVGKKGGRKASKAMTPEQRKQRARNAAKARWGRKKAQ